MNNKHFSGMRQPAKRDADYAVAKEKCDAMAGATRELCMDNAKKQIGKYTAWQEFPCSGRLQRRHSK
ncbi:MAG: hypothetical protein Q7S94_02170 [Gallionella sp.]|nr:hypothetical protein [Gallionella sp.]